MLKNRVIPSLLLDNGRLVKTTKFRNPMYVGDPLNAIRIFNEKEVDELLLLDISASRQARGPDFGLLAEIAGECFMPLSYGGGISKLDQAAQLFNLGIEKVCLQTAAFSNLNLVSDIAKSFGSQSVMVSIDLKRSWLGKAKLYSSTSRKLRSEPWLSTIQKFISAGAGEILLNAVDRDGTLSGPDLELIREASSFFSVPLIAVGGVSCLGDIKAAVKAGASAVAAGAFFVFQGPHRAVLISYPQYHELELLFKDIE